MIARWIEQGQWARGPLCFSSSGGWELLMDPNWTHIYCAWFSWSVTVMMMPQLETINRMTVLAFWKVNPTGVFFFCCCCLFFFFFFPSVILLSKHKCPVAFWESHHVTKRMMVTWVVACWGVGQYQSFLALKDICQNVWNRQPSEKAVLWAGCPRVQVIVTHVFRAKCEQSREASECQSQ